MRARRFFLLKPLMAGEIRSAFLILQCRKLLLITVIYLGEFRGQKGMDDSA